MLNTVLYNRKERLNNEVKKRIGNDSRTTSTSSLAAAIEPNLSGYRVTAAPSYENTDALFDRKIDLVTAGIDQFFSSKLRTLPKHNALTIIDYVLAMKNEINLSDGYRRLNIYVLYSISKFFANKKTYREITRDDVLQYLDSLRKSEASDPLHRWIGTYNVYRVLFIVRLSRININLVKM